jgi:hypothetical protein
MPPHGVGSGRHGPHRLAVVHDLAHSLADERRAEWPDALKAYFASSRYVAKDELLRRLALDRLHR